jgi:hypothetical protein
VNGDPADVADEANWLGGYYELAIEIGGRDDATLDAALKQLWRAARIEGCYLGGAVRADKLGVLCALKAMEQTGSLVGTTRLPDGRDVVAGACANRFDDGEDWLCLFVPMGALERIDARTAGHPYGPRAGVESLQWRRPLDDWLVAIARMLPPRFAIVGFDVSCERPAQIPDDRYEGYLLPDGSYFPATR